jgi:hypothetical protein
MLDGNEIREGTEEKEEAAAEIRKDITKRKSDEEKKSPPPKKRRKRRPPAVPWKKPKDMPRRPLSSYNLFFKEQRELLIGGKAKQGPPPEVKKKGIGFANLAKSIGAKWKNLDQVSREPYEAIAAEEKDRYNQEIIIWRAKRKEEKERAAQVQEETKGRNESVAPSEEDIKFQRAVSVPSSQQNSEWPPPQTYPISPKMQPRLTTRPDSSRSLASLRSIDISPMSLPDHYSDKPLHTQLEMPELVNVAKWTSIGYRRSTPVPENVPFNVATTASFPASWFELEKPSEQGLTGTHAKDSVNGELLGKLPLLPSLDIFSQPPACKVPQQHSQQIGYPTLKGNSLISMDEGICWKYGKTFYGDAKCGVSRGVGPASYPAGRDQQPLPRPNRLLLPTGMVPVAAYSAQDIARRNEAAMAFEFARKKEAIMAATNAALECTAGNILGSPAGGALAESSLLRKLGMSLDDDAVDFLTSLQYSSFESASSSRGKGLA